MNFTLISELVLRFTNKSRLRVRITIFYTIRYFYATRATNVRATIPYAKYRKYFYEPMYLSGVEIGLSLISLAENYARLQ